MDYEHDDRRAADVPGAPGAEETGLPAGREPHHADSSSPRSPEVRAFDPHDGSGQGPSDLTASRNLAGSSHSDDLFDAMFLSGGGYPPAFAAVDHDLGFPPPPAPDLASAFLAALDAIDDRRFVTPVPEEPPAARVTPVEAVSANADPVKGDAKVEPAYELRPQSRLELESADRVDRSVSSVDGTPASAGPDAGGLIESAEPLPWDTPARVPVAGLLTAGESEAAPVGRPAESNVEEFAYGEHSESSGQIAEAEYFAAGRVEQEEEVEEREDALVDEELMRLSDADIAAALEASDAPSADTLSAADADAEAKVLAALALAEAEAEAEAAALAEAEAAMAAEAASEAAAATLSPDTLSAGTLSDADADAEAEVLAALALAEAEAEAEAAALAEAEAEAAAAAAALAEAAEAEELAALAEAAAAEADAGLEEVGLEEVGLDDAGFDVSGLEDAGFDDAELEAAMSAGPAFDESPGDDDFELEPAIGMDPIDAAPMAFDGPDAFAPAPAAAAPEPEPEPESDELEDLQDFVVFSLGDMRCVVPIRNVVEVGRIPDAAPVPNAPAWLYGLGNLRGQVLSLIDLRAFFGVGRIKASTGRMVVLRGDADDITAGVMVDQVHQIVALSPSRFKDAPAALPLPDKSAGFVWGACDYGNFTMIGLDVDGVLGVEGLTEQDSVSTV